MSDERKVDVLDRIVDAALDLMVRRANSTDAYATYTKADVLSVIASDQLGETARYFAQLVAWGIEWLTTFREVPELLDTFGARKGGVL